MPGFVKTAEDERLWSEAKKQAKKQGRSGDYAYVTGIYKQMRKSEAGPAGLADLLACLRRAYELAHSFHWRTSGASFVGDHELFSKIYSGLYGFIDPLAEKIVGMGGEAQVEAGKQARATAKEHSPSAVTEPGKFPEELLAVVNDLLSEINEAIDDNDDDGVENMLQGMVDEIQTFQYLLQQRSSSPAQKSGRGLILDLNKSAGLLRGHGLGEEKRWTRFPGAASMFNGRDAEARETQKLMTSMPTPKMAISDGNFTSPDDVVKGLGFGPTEETLWAHRVARMVDRAPSEMALRKAVVGDLRGETLEGTLRAEMARRILSLYRQRTGGKPLEKAFPPKKNDAGADKKPPMMGGADKKAPMSAGFKPGGAMAGGKPGGPMGKPSAPAAPNAGGDAQRQPAVDAAELTEMPDDKSLLQNKLHALHEDLKSCQGPITGNAALIHMHNDLKAQMRDAYRDPDPGVVADIDHKIHHFKKLLEGPPEPEMDPNDPSQQQGAPGKPAPGGFGARGGPPKPGAMAGQPPPGRQPGKRPPPMMGKSMRMQGAPTPGLGQHAKGTPHEGRGFAMKPKGQIVVAGKKSAASHAIKHKKPKGGAVKKGGPPRPFDLGRRALAAAAFDDFIKGAGHKYLRRLPTGKVKPKYTYIYNAAKAVDTKARPKVGEKIKVSHEGQAGHYEVKRVMRDGRVEMQHDETGHRMVIHRSKLHDLVRDVHGPVDHHLENQRLDEKHRKSDLLPKSRKAVLDVIKEASGIDDHDLAQADAAYAKWKAGGKKGPKPTRAAGKGGELDAFSGDLKRGKKFSSLLEAFEQATKGATTWRDIAPAIHQLREVPGFENAHLPEDALLRHAMQDKEREEAPDTRRVDPEKYGSTVPSTVDEGGFDWSAGEQHGALATEAQAKATAKRARDAKKAGKKLPAIEREPPAVADDEPRGEDEGGDTSFDFGANVPDKDEGGDTSFDFGANVKDREEEMRRSLNLVIDLRKAFDGHAPAPSAGTAVGRRGEGSRGGKIVGHTPGGDPIYASAAKGKPESTEPSASSSDPKEAFAKLQQAHAAAMQQMQEAHAAMMAHAQKHGIQVPGAGGTQTGPDEPTRVRSSVARGKEPQGEDEATGVVAPQKPVEKTTTGKDMGKRDAVKTAADKHLSGPESGESPEESVPKADGILQHGIVGHTSTGKQIKLGMDHDKLTPQEAHEASLLHRDAQEHLLNAARHTPNPEYKKAARSHLDEEFALASKGVNAQTGADQHKDPDDEQIESVFASTKKSLAGLEALASWAPSPMWKGKNIGSSFGLMLRKSLGAERQGHKYIKRIPKAGGGYDYTYADTPHSKMDLKGAPVGSTLTALHNGESATYTKTGRDDWQGATGGPMASGWFVGKPGTLTHPGGHEAEAKPSPAAPVLHTSSSSNVAAGMPPSWRAEPTPMAQATKEAEKQPAPTKPAAKPVQGSLFDMPKPAAPSPTPEPKPTPMAEAAKEAAKQPAERPSNFDTMPDDVAAAWKVTYDAEAEDAKEAKAAARSAEHVDRAQKAYDAAEREHKSAQRAIDYDKEHFKVKRDGAPWAAKPTQLKSLDLRAQELSHAKMTLKLAKERAEAQIAERAKGREDRKAAAERHAREAPERTKVAAAARKRIAEREAEQKAARPTMTAATRTSRQRERETGEHVEGSAKDRSDERRMITTGDLGSMTFSEAHRLVNKRNAMPVYGADEFQAKGASPGAAHMGLALANLVAVSPPEDSDEARRSYLEGIRLVHGVLDNAITVDDYEEARKELEAMHRSVSSHSGSSRHGIGVPKEEIHTAREYTKEEKEKRSNEYTMAYQRARRDRTPLPQYPSEYEGLEDARYPSEHAKTLEARLHKNTGNTDLGVHYEHDGDTVRFFSYSKSAKSGLTKAFDALGKRFNEQVLSSGGKIWNEAMEKAREAEGMGLAGWDHLDKTDEEKAKAREATKAEKAKLAANESGSGKETKLRWRRSISEKPAVLNPKVTITKADPERFRSTFGFRGEQPGEAIPDDELNHHRKYAEMAFHDLADVLGVDPKHVSMNGRLAMAFAARGKGGAMAHYEPENKVINITRFAGAGTIAHEWGHFMDNVVAEQHRGSSTKSAVYGSAGEGAGMPENLSAAYKKFNAALKEANPKTIERSKAELIDLNHEQSALRKKLNEHPAHKRAGKDAAQIKNEIEHYRSIEGDYKGITGAIRARESFLRNPTSDYMHNAVMMDGGKVGKYWSNPQELFARAFESHVQHKLESNGRRNSYLVDGTTGPGPYPQDDELEKIHGGIKAVLSAIKDGGLFEKALKAMASMPLTARARPRLVIAA